MENPISERFKKVRKDLNLTQSAFADGLKIKQSSISTIEGGGNPDISTLTNIANIYNVNLNWLIIGEGSMFKGSNSNASTRELEDEIMRLQTEMEALQDQVLMLVRDKAKLEKELNKKAG
jgi:transcriptional regulator with XRE-family HTH domain